MPTQGQPKSEDSSGWVVFRSLGQVLGLEQSLRDVDKTATQSMIPPAPKQRLSPTNSKHADWLEQARLAVEKLLQSAIASPVLKNCDAIFWFLVPTSTVWIIDESTTTKS